jgi:deoxyribose-phosphate aldolase
MTSGERDRLLERARAAVPDAACARRILPLLDLTSLRGDETPGEIEALAGRAVRHGVAAICIPPDRLAGARALLAGSAVRLATVAAFPGGGDDPATAAAEVAAAVEAGAQEVDVVAPLGAVLAGDLASVSELVEACRAAAGPDTTLKLILETGLLRESPLIAAAARAAVMAGIDFLKTSTGKIPEGATLEAAAVLLEVIGEAEGRVGLKLSGGIRRVADAAPYLALVDAMRGSAWASPARLRIGASALLDDLLRVAAEAGA